MKKESRGVQVIILKVLLFKVLLLNADRHSKAHWLLGKMKINSAHTLCTASTAMCIHNDQQHWPNLFGQLWHQLYCSIFECTSIFLQIPIVWFVPKFGVFRCGWLFILCVSIEKNKYACHSHLFSDLLKNSTPPSNSPSLFSI